MEYKKHKTVLFVIIGIVLVVVLVGFVVALLGNSEDAIEQESVGTIDTNNLDDIYAKLPDFDVVLKKPDITQEQKENAIKNARTFIALCEESHSTYNDNLPEWTEEYKEQYIREEVEAYDVSYESAYEAYKDYTTHPDLVDTTQQLYTVGRLSHNDNKVHPQALFCYIPGWLPPGYNATYRYDESLVTLAYNAEGTTSIYDVWEGEVKLATEPVNGGYTHNTENKYIQYIGL